MQGYLTDLLEEKKATLLARIPVMDFPPEVVHTIVSLWFYYNNITL